MDDKSDARWMVGDLLERYVDAAFPRRSWGRVVRMGTHLVFVFVIGSMKNMRVVDRNALANPLVTSGQGAAGTRTQRYCCFGDLPL